VLFLKGALEILNAIPNKPAFAFGMQRLSAGVGVFVSALIGGALYDFMQNSHRLSTFWSVLAVQALIVAVLALVVLSFKRKLAVVNG
jgi:Co/Zn/Cd efflux system component